MLEKEVIQTRGFHNIIKDGEIIGFQFKVRLNYYRGIFLSQLRPGKVTVDGEEFPKDTVIWEIGGVEYTPEQMKGLGNIHWGVLQPATIKVLKPGGLSQGFHEVGINYLVSASYLPPSLEANLDPDAEVQHRLSGFGGKFSRTLIMV